MTKINICTFKSDKGHRLRISQEISANLGLTNPADLEHVRINKILRYWDIHKYAISEQNVRICGSKLKLQESMEPNQCCLNP